MSNIDRYISLDEEGYFVFDGQRVEEENLGQTLLTNLRINDWGTITTSIDGQPAYVEAFDAPLIARHVSLDENGTMRAACAYNTIFKLPLNSLSCDEWDRFHALTENGIPVVFSRSAQVEFFDLLENFDDDSVTIAGQHIEVPAWLNPSREVNQENFWTDIYRSEQPGWELGRENPALAHVLPQLKLSKSRVLVLGCGNGHDAAFFARHGHIVTAVDFSPEAISRAQNDYGSLENLKFVQADAFQLPQDWNGRFDLIFEHTFYCAISPDRRNEVVQLWKRMLHTQGHLLGIFFAMEKRQGPAFGGSEWEIRQRLKKNFAFLFWTRWRHSIERRAGTELVIFARKL